MPTLLRLSTRARDAIPGHIRFNGSLRWKARGPGRAHEKFVVAVFWRNHQPAHVSIDLPMQVRTAAATAGARVPQMRPSDNRLATLHPNGALLEV